MKSWTKSMFGNDRTAYHKAQRPSGSLLRSQGFAAHRRGSCRLIPSRGAPSEPCGRAGQFDGVHIPPGSCSGESAGGSRGSVLRPIIGARMAFMPLSISD